jgi:TRAP transporter TatT component family protein
MVKQVYCRAIQFKQITRFFGQKCRILETLCLLSLFLPLTGTLVGCTESSNTSSEGENATAGSSPVERIAEADVLYSQRKDLAKVRSAIFVLRQAQIADDVNYEVASRLAKFNYYLGAHGSDDGERESAFRDGIEAGKTAVHLQDNRADGHFWLGANYGGSAEMSLLVGFSNFQDIRGEMERVIEIDERYEAGSAYMVLGQLYLKAPRMLGGDNKKALEYLEKVCPSEATTGYCGFIWPRLTTRLVAIRRPANKLISF